MATLVNLQCNKSYATRENAIKAVEKKDIPSEYRYILMQTEDGRWFPVFVGGEKLLQAGIHFHFNCLG